MFNRLAHKNTDTPRFPPEKQYVGLVSDQARQFKQLWKGMNLRLAEVSLEGNACSNRTLQLSLIK